MPIVVSTTIIRLKHPAIPSPSDDLSARYTCDVDSLLAGKRRGERIPARHPHGHSAWLDHISKVGACRVIHYRAVLDVADDHQHNIRSEIDSAGVLERCEGFAPLPASDIFEDSCASHAAVYVHRLSLESGHRLARDRCQRDV